MASGALNSGISAASRRSIINRIVARNDDDIERRNERIIVAK